MDIFKYLWQIENLYIAMQVSALINFYFWSQEKKLIKFEKKINLIFLWKRQI